MIISCSCGNSFNFDTAKDDNNEGSVKGFQFITGDNEKHGEYLALRCMNCDKTIVLTNPSVEED